MGICVHEPNPTRATTMKFERGVMVKCAVAVFLRIAAYMSGIHKSGGVAAWCWGWRSALLTGIALGFRSSYEL